MAQLGVNIDHVATLRQARGTVYPNPIEAALIAEEAGATGITAHLREDRRHIQTEDIFALRHCITSKLNLEMALSDDILEVALRVGPDEVCLVPERRQELTTEGGLDVCLHFERIIDFIEPLHHKGIRVSLFIDPDPEQVQMARKCGADLIELHTGTYANHFGDDTRTEFSRLKAALELGLELGLGVNAGHGLNLDNIHPIASLPGMGDLNIGHSIISRAIYVGMKEAVSEMVRLIQVP